MVELNAGRVTRDRESGPENLHPQLGAARRSSSLRNLNERDGPGTGPETRPSEASVPSAVLPFVNDLLFR